MDKPQTLGRNPSRKKMEYHIEKISRDNCRPGMPKNGWLVWYNSHPDFGWLSVKTFATKKEAEEFVQPAGKYGS